MMSQEERKAVASRYRKEYQDKNRADKEEAERKHKIAKRIRKEEIREICHKVVETHPNWNDFSKSQIDGDLLIYSLIPWVLELVLTGKEHKDQPPYEDAYSRPDISHIHSHLVGKTTPLTTDLGICLAPKVRSDLDKNTPKRIFNAFRSALFGHATKEDKLKDQQIHIDHENKKLKDHERARKAREDRIKEEEEEKKKQLEDPVFREKALAAWNLEEKKRRKAIEERDAAAKTKAKEQGRKKRKEMREDMNRRRREMYGNKT